MGERKQRMALAKRLFISERTYVVAIYDTRESEELYVDRVLLTNGRIAGVIGSKTHTPRYAVIGDFTEDSEESGFLQVYDSREMVIQLRAGSIPETAPRQSSKEIIDI
jgi:hypothetical protein